MHWRLQGIRPEEVLPPHQVRCRPSLLVLQSRVRVLAKHHDAIPWRNAPEDEERQASNAAAGVASCLTGNAATPSCTSAIVDERSRCRTRLPERRHRQTSLPRRSRSPWSWTEWSIAFDKVCSTQRRREREYVEVLMALGARCAVEAPRLFEPES